MGIGGVSPGSLRHTEWFLLFRPSRGLLSDWWEAGRGDLEGKQEGVRWG